MALVRMNSIQVALPKTSDSPKSIKQKIILSIKKNGDIFVNKTMVTLDGVGIALAQAMKETPQDVVLVNADEGAFYGTVIKAMDKARLIGVRKFALATDAEGK